MKEITRENRFDEAIKALVKGFFNGTLAKGTCRACAVGNIVANAIGVEPFLPKGQSFKNMRGINWFGVIYPHEIGFRDILEGEKEIANTGYSEHEISEIEQVFENNTEIDCFLYPLDYKSDPKIIKDQYNGLMAVVDVLCELEGFNKEKVKETKELFNYSK